MKLREISFSGGSTPWARLLNTFKAFDFFQIFVIILLMGYGVAFIYGSGHQYGTMQVSNFWVKQLMWIGVGFFFYLGLSLLDYRVLGKISHLIYVLAVLLLIYVLLTGRPIYGAKRWIDLGFFNYQPSELGKLAFLILSAWLLSAGFNPNKVLTWCILGLLAGLMTFLIVIEPDLGSALVIVFLFFITLFFAGIRKRYLLFALLIFCAAAPVGYMMMKDYHKGRIEVFLDPTKDLRGKGWNAYQAELAVGSGGVTGKGYMKGTVHTLGYLPRTVSNNDFIFSVIAEETGLVGSCGLILLYFLLIGSAIRAACYAPDSFGRIVAGGIAGIFFMHTMVNIGMNIRLAPVTGLPLPLVSYGGSFMVSTLIYLGILQSIFMRRRKDS